MRGRIVIAALVALALVGSVGAGRATAGLNIDFNLIAQPQLVVVPGTPVAYAPPSRPTTSSTTASTICSPMAAGSWPAATTAPGWPCPPPMCPGLF
jgi:hypothetical protein